MITYPINHSINLGSRLTNGAHDEDGAAVEDIEMQQSLRDFTLEGAPGHGAVRRHLETSFSTCSWGKNAR